MRKPILIAALLGAMLVGALFLGDLEPARIGAAVEWLGLWRAAHPGVLPALYFLTYVAVTALSLPVAVWMTLGAGALFGVPAGLAIVLPAASLGATGAFLAARYLARDWVRGRLGGRHAPIEAGLARDGAYYLFSLRLIPVVPFFAVNLAFGLGPMRALTFLWVSLLGMAPGTVAFLIAGRQLGQIRSPADVLSPGLIGAFVLLGLMPWIARGLLRLVSARRRGMRWTRPARFERNLVVIGGGAAGLVAAYVAAAAKARVTLITEGPMGGDCLNTGCVPSKALIAAAAAAKAAHGAPALGITGAPPKVDFPAVMAHVRATIAAIEPKDSEARYTALGVEVVRGRAVLVDPWTVAVGDRRITTRAVVLATGAAPVIPPIPGIGAVGALTSDTLWDHLAGLDTPPQDLLILGGGPIGCEIAQALARLGAGVTLIEAERILPRDLPEAAALVEAALVRDGVRLITGRVARFEAGRAVLEDGCDIGFGTLLVATGRRARTEGFGLEALGIPAGAVIEANDYLQTLHPNIFVVGDAAGPAQLTNAAGHQGWIAAANALAAPVWRFRAAAPMPQAIFTDPQIARVGPGPAEAAAIPHEVTHFPFADLDRALAEGRTEGFVHVMTVPGSDRILGATVVGPNAGEIVAEFALAMRNGLGLGKILATPHLYPGWSEAAKSAAGRWRAARVNPRALRLANWYFTRRRG